VSGLDAHDIELHVLSSAVRSVGAFSCSDPLVDTLQRNIVTSLRANFISVPTDCPQRNERLGWTADLPANTSATLVWPSGARTDLSAGRYSLEAAYY
jgi:hypothetical protein